MPRVIEPITEDTIEQSMPREKQYVIFDGGELFLLVKPSGSKLWRFKYRFGGKDKRIALGAYPAIALEEARIKRDAAKELLLKGFDPAEIKKEEKARDKADRLETAMVPSVRATFDGKIELWKGNNTMRLTWDEARFVGSLLTNITRE